MDALRACCGLQPRGPLTDEEQQPLLAQYDDETALQRQLHQKLHTYQMVRALTRGYMPSTEQVIVNLRTLLASDVLGGQHDELSDAGQALLHYTRQWIKQFITLLEHKNKEDQIQDFLWYLSKARVVIDTDDLADVASRSKAKADTKAAYQSLQTVGSLLLTNSDFCLFLSDLNTVAKEVLQDTAFTLSRVSAQAGKQLEPSNKEQQELHQSEGNGKSSHEHEAVSQDDLATEATEVGEVLAESAGKVAEGVEESLARVATGEEKDTLLYRLKRTVVNLRKRRDYSESVSTLSLLLRRYLLSYAHLGRDIAQTLEEDVHTNAETDRALHNFWVFVTSFGSRTAWNDVEARAKAVWEHGKDDPQFDELVRQTGNLLQDMLMDPAFFDDAEARFEHLRDNFRVMAAESSLREDVDNLLEAIGTAIRSIREDQEMARLLDTTRRIAKILSPAGRYVNGQLISDMTSVFVPLLVEAIRYVPIPRLEVSTPEVDLLLENLILEPGRTINNTSFLPFRLRVETHNNFEIRKARFRTTTAVESLMTIKVAGLSIAAEELGFWMRAHSGILNLADEGIASFHLDERGIDIELDVEIAKERMEQILTLHAVRVRIHKLSYTLRRSRFSFIAWLFKPLLQPILRTSLEAQLAQGIADALRTANRELLYARERLRATRVADPDNLWTFVKAVAARLVPEEDPDLYTRVGIDEPGRGIFKGVYAPGSIVKLWHEEAMQAAQRTREYEREGWRNDIFGTPVVAAPAPGPSVTTYGT